MNRFQTATTRQPWASSASSSRRATRRKDGDEGDAGALPGRVLQGEVLDVDAGGADVGEEPAQLTGGVGYQDLDLGVAARRATVLAGNAGPARYYRDS